MRDGLSLLDQAIAFGGGEVRGEAVKSMIGVIGSDRIYGLVEALLAADGASLLGRVSEMAEMAVDFSQALQELLTMLHQIALLQLVSGYQPDDGYDRERLSGFSEALSAEDVQLYYQVGLLGQQELNLAPDPRSGFEMVLLRMLAFRPDGEGANNSQSSGGGQRSARTPIPKAAPSKATGNGAPTSVAKPSRVLSEPSKPVAKVMHPSDWEGFCAALQLGGITRQLAQNCAFESWDGKVLNLTLDTSRRQLRVGQSEMRFLEAVRKQLGETAQLSITEAVPQQETPAMREKREAEERQAEAETSMGADPLVKEMEQRFGAKLMPESIRPADDSAP
jgi:DNA polymerase-3 subunit gamma/tau